MLKRIKRPVSLLPGSQLEWMWVGSMIQSVVIDDRWDDTSDIEKWYINICISIQFIIWILFYTHTYIYNPWGTMTGCQWGWDNVLHLNGEHSHKIDQPSTLGRSHRTGFSTYCITACCHEVRNECKQQKLKADNSTWNTMTTRFPEPICINKSWFLDNLYIHHTKSTATVAPVSTSSGWSLFLLSASTVDGSGHHLSWVFFGHPSVRWEINRCDFKSPEFCGFVVSCSLKAMGLDFWLHVWSSVGETVMRENGLCFIHHPLWCQAFYLLSCVACPTLMWTWGEEFWAAGGVLYGKHSEAMKKNE